MTSEEEYLEVVQRRIDQLRGELSPEARERLDEGVIVWREAREQWEREEQFLADAAARRQEKWRDVWEQVFRVDASSGCEIVWSDPEPREHVPGCDRVLCPCGLYP